MNISYDQLTGAFGYAAPLYSGEVHVPNYELKRAVRWFRASRRYAEEMEKHGPGKERSFWCERYFRASAKAVRASYPRLPSSCYQELLPTAYASKYRPAQSSRCSVPVL